ncbi:MAG: hypothetical protein JXR68_01055 [Bacteroidales bacterium]|nr:hypothetical protein [Bacteroidales bacterium]
MKDKNKLVKLIAQIVGIGTIAISVVLAFLYYAGIKDENALASNVDLMFTWTVILVVAIVAFAFVIGPIVSILNNPQTLIKGLVSIGVLAVVVIIAYSLTNPDVSRIQLMDKDKIVNLEKQITFAETGIISFYIFTGLVILGIVISEIKGLLKL